MPAYSSQPTGRLQRLPLVTLYLSERCNSRCITCDYWRHGRADLDLPAVERLLPGLRALQTELVLISGGEPLLNPQWQAIAACLREQNLALWLLTSGLSLAKHARAAAGLFDSITVSLDGANPATYAAIRGLDAFGTVCAGIRAAVACGTPVGLRVTLQRSNYREIPEFITLAHELGASRISFLAVDVANPHAFGRTESSPGGLALEEQDLPVLARILQQLQHDRAADLHSGFIAESSAKLRRIGDYFAAVLGKGAYPPVRCNAPEFSAVVDAQRRIRPCFFISGPSGATVHDDLSGVLNDEEMLELRDAIRERRRPECTTCVCSLWRDPVTHARA